MNSRNALDKLLNIEVHSEASICLKGDKEASGEFLGFDGNVVAIKVDDRSFTVINWDYVESFTIYGDEGVEL